MPGCRSSDFFCRVHLLVALSTASRMSSAMLRGRVLVIGLDRILGEDDRAFAAVGVLDVGRCQMQRADHRLVGTGPHLGQGGPKPLPSRSEGTERIVYPDAPVRAGDERSGLSGTLRQAGLMQAEGKLDDVGNALAGEAFALLILERFGVAARRQH